MKKILAMFTILSMTAAMMLPVGTSAAQSQEIGQLHAAGDMDGDGLVNMLDVYSVYNSLSGNTDLTAAVCVTADIDRNGECNMMDTLAAYQTVSGQASALTQAVAFTAWYVDIADTAADTVYDYDTATVLKTKEENSAFMKAHAQDENVWWYGGGYHVYSTDDHILIAVPMMEGGESVGSVVSDDETVYVSMVTASPVAVASDEGKRTAFAMIEVSAADIEDKTVKILRYYDDTVVKTAITDGVMIDTNAVYNYEHNETNGEYYTAVVESVDDMNAYIDDEWDRYYLNDGFTDSYDDTFFKDNVLVLVNCRTVISVEVISDVSSFTVFEDRIMLTLEYRSCNDWLYSHPSLHPHAIAVPIPRDVYNGEKIEVLYRDRGEYWASGLFDCSRC